MRVLNRIFLADCDKGLPYPELYDICLSYCLLHCKLNLLTAFICRSQKSSHSHFQLLRTKNDIGKSKTKLVLVIFKFSSAPPPSFLFFPGLPSVHYYYYIPLTVTFENFSTLTTKAQPLRAAARTPTLNKTNKFDSKLNENGVDGLPFSVCLK